MFSDIDDIVLSYVNGILEDLVEEENPEQNFDSEDFLEMILAYLTQLEGIDVSFLILPHYDIKQYFLASGKKSH